MSAGLGAALGVSHLVLGCRDLGAAEDFLRGYDYRRQGAVSGAPNPVQKAKFVAGSLAPSFDMRLMVSTTGSPAVELLRENSGAAAAGESRMLEAVLAGPTTSASDDEVIRAIEDNTPPPFPGFRLADDVRGEAKIIGVVVRCSDLAAALGLWALLGYHPARLGSRLARIRIESVVPTGRLAVYFVEDRRSPAAASLDHQGLVCLSLFCREASALASAFATEGYLVSECFELQPFAERFQVVFVRNGSGEIYEFLSLGARRADRV